MKKKITIELGRFKRLDRMCDFGVANRHRFEAGAPAAEALPMMTSTITSLKERTASQASAENRLRELSRLKMAARSALSADVEFLYHTSRAIAAETLGFDEKFCMGLENEAKLLNAARSALQDAAPVADVFIRHAMPQDFLERLDASIRTFERAREEYATHKTACSAGATALKISMDKARAAASRFDAIIRNTLRGDSATLDAWKRICRLPRTPRKKESSEDGPAPAPVVLAESA